MLRTTRSKLIPGVALAAVVAAAALAAGGAWFACAGGVRAPEPARLNGSLNATSIGATYVTTFRQTSAYFLSNTSWTLSSLPVGYPCSATWGLAGGSTVYGVVMASGNYRKCSV